MGVLKLVLLAGKPLLFGLIIAYITNILMSFYERHYFMNSQSRLVKKSRRAVCMMGAFVTFVAVVALMLLIVIPELIACLKLLFMEVPETLGVHLDKLLEAEFWNDEVTTIFEGMQLEQIFETIGKNMASGIESTFGYAVGMVSSVTSAVLNWLIGFIFAIYLLLGKDKLQDQGKRLMKHYLKAEWNEKLLYVMKTANECFKRYFVGQCLEAVILGSLCALGMKLFGFPYASVVGVTIGVTALIPVAGAYIGGAVGFLLILTVSLKDSLLFLLYLVVLQQLEGNIIYPRVVGTSLGLPGIWVLAAVTIGGGVSGILGMMVGVPITATLYRIIKEDVHKRESETCEQN